MIVYEIIELISNNEYDFVALQEVMRKIDDNVFDKYNKSNIIKANSNYKYSFFGPLWIANHHEKNNVISKDFGGFTEQGNEVLSKYPIIQAENFLNKIYSENNFDGVECYYTTFSERQTKYLLEFVKERNLLISGGSDYHGLNKNQHDLGIGKGNLSINKDTISSWDINFYKKETM